MISINDPNDDHTYFLYKGFIILYDRDDYDEPNWEILGLRVDGKRMRFSSIADVVKYMGEVIINPDKLTDTIDVETKSMITEQLCDKITDAMTYIKHLAPIGLTEYCISGKANEDIIQWELVLSRIIENLPSLKKDKTDSE
jgi:hypothetical protein